MLETSLLGVLPNELIVRVLILLTWKENVNIVRRLSKRFKSLIDNIPSVVISFWIIVEFQLPEPAIDNNWPVFRSYYIFKTKQPKQLPCENLEDDARHKQEVIKDQRERYGERKFIGGIILHGYWSPGIFWNPPPISECSCIPIRILFTRIRCHPMERFVLYHWDQQILAKIDGFINEEFGSYVALTFYSTTFAGGCINVTEYSFVNGCTLEVYSGPGCLAGLNLPKELAVKQKNSGRKFHTTLFLAGARIWRLLAHRLWSGTALHSVTNIIWYFSKDRKDEFYSIGVSKIKMASQVAQELESRLEISTAKVKDIPDIIEYLKLPRTVISN